MHDVFFIARPDQKIHMSRTLALNAPTTPQKQPQRKLLNSNAPHPSTWHQTVHSLYVAFRKHVLGLRRLQRGLGKLHSSQCSVARCTSTELIEIPNPDIFQAKERSPGLRPGCFGQLLTLGAQNAIYFLLAPTCGIICSGLSTV